MTLDDSGEVVVGGKVLACRGMQRVLCGMSETANQANSIRSSRILDSEETG